MRRADRRVSPIKLEHEKWATERSRDLKLHLFAIAYPAKLGQQLDQIAAWDWKQGSSPRSNLESQPGTLPLSPPGAKSTQ
jgi:hypothetical protein